MTLKRSRAIRKVTEIEKSMLITLFCSFAVIAITNCSGYTPPDATLGNRIGSQPMFKLCLLNHGMDPDQYLACVNGTNQVAASDAFWGGDNAARGERRCREQFVGNNSLLVERCSAQADAAEVRTHQTTEQTCRFVPFQGQVCTSESSGVSQ
jgi:hypothetical protein